ncbi:MAG: RNA polymerase-associated protein RapA [Dehalococcoidia bacterium]|nr:RNA polymerase-associated protein RapA [Chloroflexota bacterium]
MSMHQVLGDVALVLVSILDRELSSSSEDWWEKLVVERLSIQQQRLVADRRVTSLSGLDLAGLLRVFDQNWMSLSSSLCLDQQARNWLKETQGIRNRWAHLPPGGLRSEDVYRDLDTLCRLFVALGADQATLDRAQTERSKVLKEIAPRSEDKEVAVQAEQPRGLVSKGSVVRLRARPDITGAVLDVLPGDPEARFTVFHGGEIATYYESQVEPIIAKPARTIVEPDGLHAAMTATQLRHPSTKHLYSLHASRINFVPYQFRPVLKLIQADRPRLLIADEVGVGKTIEAGLILKELQARRELKSVLVICPKPLVAERKWMEELKRFDEQFTHLDGDALRYCIDETHLDGVWPQQYSRSIVPYSLFDEVLLLGKQGKGRKIRGLLDLDPPPVFDLVIVDEAHHIRNTDTWAYRTVRYFCDNAEAVVLLSATPIQLGDDDLFNLLQLVRPDLLPSRRDFDHMAEPNPHINAAIEVARNAGPGWMHSVRDQLTLALRTDWGSSVLSADQRVQPLLDALDQQEIRPADRLNIVRDLEALYTFAPIINRTRRRDIGNFTTRKPETVSVDFTPEQEALHRGVLDLFAKMLAHRHGDQNLKFMMTTIRRQVASCVFGLAPYLESILSGQISKLELSESDSADDFQTTAEAFIDVRADVDALVRVAKSLSSDDPKFSAFSKVIKDKQALENNKLLVFSTFRHTLSYLVERLQEMRLRIGLIHGDVPEEDRRELRKRFSLPKENPRAIDLLLSSEVGCEGLDYQFCDAIVNYDLPWNPMRVEQRIGRIDRYGQLSETVAIFNFVTPGTVDAEIYERCLLRIGVFRQALGGSEEILGNLTQEIRGIAENLQLSLEEQKRRLQQLADNEIRVMQEQMLLEEQQATLFGLSVPKQDEELVKGASSFWLTPPRIRNLIERYFSALEGGRSYKLNSRQPVASLQLNQDMRNRLIDDFKAVAQPGAADKAWERWLKGGEPYLRVTFDPVAADDDRAAMFVTPTHPLARQAAKALDPSATLACSVSAKSFDVPPGRYPFAIYRWKILGLTESFGFQPVCESEELAKAILGLLESAAEAQESSDVSPDEEKRLEAKHYRVWLSSRGEHIESATRAADAKLASLNASHRARVALLEEQRDQATDARIRRMKDGQLESANRDYERRRSELESVAGKAEIVAEAAVLGVLYVEN